MEELARFHIPKLFDSIICSQNSCQCQYETIVHHVGCGTTFKCQFEERYVMRRGYVTNSEYYYCPVCGEASNRDKSIAFVRPDTDIPIDLDIWVQEGRHFVDLNLRYNTVHISEESQSFKRLKPFVTKIRFDFKQRQTIITEKRYMAPDTKEVFNPLTRIDRRIKTNFYETALLYCNDESLAKQYRAEFTNLFKVLRTAFERKLAATVGYKIKDVYMPLSFASEGGIGCEQLFNLSWKMIFPDAPAFNGRLHVPLIQWSHSNMHGKSVPIEASLSEHRKSKQSFYELVAGSKTANVRKWMIKSLQKDVGTAVMFPMIEAITDDINVQSNLMKVIGQRQWFFKSLANNQESWRLFIDAYQHLGPNVVKLCGINQIEDTLRMYKSLTVENKARLWSSKPKIRDMHDAVMVLHDSQEFENIDLPILQAFNENLAGLEFFVPVSVHQLADIGTSLKNCVRSYRDKIMAGTCLIVGVRGPSGYKACIELGMKNGIPATVNQAKLFANKPVNTDNEFNDFILDWAKDHKLRIETHDIIQRVA